MGFNSGFKGLNMSSLFFYECVTLLVLELWTQIDLLVLELWTQIDLLVLELWTQINLLVLELWTQIDLLILHRMDGLLKLIGGILLTGLAVMLGGNLQCYILHHKSERDCRENDLERESVWHRISRNLTHTCTAIYI